MQSALNAGTDEKDKIKLRLRWYHQYQFAGYYAAKELGFYEKAGFDVEIIEGGPYTDVADEVVSGRASYGVQTPSILVDRSKGLPVTVLAAVFQHSPVALIVNKESGIEYLSQLTGKKIMMGLKNVEIRSMLLNEGLIDKVEIIEFNGNYQDVLEGKADASTGYITDMTYLPGQTENTFGYIRPVTYGVDFYGDCLFTSEKLIKKDPEKVKAFRDASLKGWRYAMDHPEETIKIILKYKPGLKYEHLMYEYRQMKKLIMPELLDLGNMSRGRWDHIAQTFIRVGMIDQDFEIEGFLYEDHLAGEHKRAKFALSLLAALFLTGSVILYYKYRKEKAKEALEELKHKEELAISEERFRNLIEFGADGILLGTHDGYITEVNEMACSLIGMKKEELIGKYVTAVPFTKESIEKNPLRFDLLNEGRTVVTERDILKPGNAIVNIEMKTKMMTDGSYQSIFRDITERKRIEKELKDNEEKYSRLIHNINDGIGIVDKNENFIFTNESAERIFEVERGGLTNRSLLDFISGETKEKILAETSNRQKGQSTRYELDIITAKGTKKTIQVAASPELDEKGNVIGTYGVFYDITERKRIEEKLREFNAELEIKVAERTSQLEHANKELESFSYSISHDLRAPVRHIIGFTDFFLKENPEVLNERSKETFSRITSSAHRMERLIDDLLMLSRTGRQEIFISKFNMGEVLRSVLDSYKDCKDNRNVEIRTGDMPAVNADRNLITIVWKNLIDNACKYTKGKAPAEISVSCDEKNGEYIFSITDNGVGFNPEFKHKLFGIFQRLHLEKEFPGTGIGLANVRRIISRHGGRTWAESDGEGKGASFYFTLPVQNGGGK